MKLAFTLLLLAVLAGCTNTLSPELNQCAQQSYQCERGCEQQNTPDTMSMQICLDKCIEQHNACKVQAEKITQSKR